MKLAIGLPAVLAATLLLLCYLIFIWWLDRYEREPIWLVALVFLWGATIGVGCGCSINTTLLAPFKETFSAGAAAGIGAILIAPLVEEVTKGLVFVPLVWTDHFDNETDGLIYGAASGLGFATVENLLYFVTFVVSDGFGVAAMLLAIAMRALFTAVMHSISSALLGVAVGYARHRHSAGKSRWIIYPLIGYVLAVGNHALWNGAAVMAKFNAGFQLAGIGLVILASAALFALTQWSLNREHKLIRRHLRQEADRGLLPRKHAEIIPYWTKRRKDDWLPEFVDKETYVQSATLLAFRLHQREIADGAHRESYNEEIERFRQDIEELLP
jgi:RsiW-degrading membrane proteinase PrsW (M82 family)